MQRREIIFALGSAAVLWPLAAGAQGRAPVIGFLHQGALPPASLISAFRKGLVEGGLKTGDEITIEDRSADGRYDRLPALAKELVARGVNVIACDFLPASLAAKAATGTIPVVFLTGSDPVAAGLVSNLSRPAANVTGVAFMFTRLGAKNLELLRELVPNTATVGVLINESNPNSVPQLKDLQSAAQSLGQELAIFEARTEREIDDSFAAMPDRKIDALIVSADGFLIARQDQLVQLAARYALPTIYPLSQYVAAGGLMSYGAKLAEAFRRTGIYVARILQGEKPAELPVLQSEIFELVINAKTAHSLGLTIPPVLLAQADEVIE